MIFKAYGGVFLRVGVSRDDDIDGRPGYLVSVVWRGGRNLGWLPAPVRHADVYELLEQTPLPSMQRGRIHAMIMNGARRRGLVEFPARPAPPAKTAPAQGPLSRRTVRLIDSAADRLPPHLRERFATDWAADAEWIEGRVARLWFAVTLRLVTVPRLRRAARQAERDLPRRA